uniref:Immunoglobulin superfamily member 22 n=1 Tax=Eptatretus burgeri TaxID=7764 RepID=A0A8C4WS59_EPTBU
MEYHTQTKTTTKTTKITHKGITSVQQESTTTRRKSSLASSSVSVVTHNSQVPPGKSPPEFIMKPYPVTLQEGKSAVFRARISGDPKPQVQWKRGDKACTDRCKTRYETATQEHVLQIEDTVIEDSDTYKCVVSNPYAELTYSFTLVVTENPDKVDFKSLMKRRVKVPMIQKEEKRVPDEKEMMEILLHVQKKDYEKVCAQYGYTDFRGMLKRLKQMKKKKQEGDSVTILQQLQDVEGHEDSTVTFEVQMELRDPNNAIIHWLKNGELIRPNVSLGKFTLKQIGMKHQLVISKLKQKDVGEYSIQVNEKTLSAKLRVIDELLEIISKLKKTHVKERDSAVFELKLSKPMQNVEWSFNGKPLKRSDKYDIVVLDGGTTHQLVVKDVRAADRGKYAIAIADQRSEAELVMEKEPIKFISNMKTVRVKEKNAARFECEINAKEAKVRWLKNGQEIPESAFHSGKYKVVSDGRRHELVVEDAAEGDAGQYSVVITQEADDKEYRSGADLIVDERLATLQSGLSDQEVRTGHSAEFTCILDDEKVDGVWRKDGQPITESDNITIVKQGAVHRIMIKNVHDEDMGRYSFTAKGVRTEASLEVADPPEIDPELVEKLMKEPITVKAGQTATLNIPFKGKPPPKVTWLRGDLEVEADERAKIERRKDGTTFMLSKCVRDDSGPLSLRLRSSAGSLIVNILLNVVDIPKPPQGPVEFTEHTGQRITMKWKAPKDNGGRPITGFTIERRKEGRNTWVKVGEVDQHSTTFSHEKVEEGKKYQFRIHAVNSEGLSEALESDEVHAGEPYVAPDAPTAPQATNVTKDSVTLSWVPPQNDGGNAIRGYIVERRKKNSNLWVTVNTEPVQGTELVAGKMVEGMEYEFRVRAVNAAGPGHPSPMSQAILIRDPIHPPSAVQDLEVIDTTYSSISLAWKEPKDLGGFTPFSYIVEMKPEDGVEWSRCNMNTLTDTRFTTTGLREKGRYMFRVRAINEAGLGEPCDLGHCVVAMPPPVRPKFKLTAGHKSYLFLKAGDAIRLNIPFIGVPEPKVAWLKDGRALADRASVANTKGFSQLQVASADRSDAGLYTITIENEIGSETFNIHIEVADIPRPPGKICLAEEIQNTVTLNWEPSPDDSPTDRLHYVVLKRDSSTMTWYTLSDRVANTKYIATDLIPGRKYYFRIIAKSELGCSDPSDSKEAWLVPKQKNLFDVKIEKYHEKERESAPEFVLELKDHCIPCGCDCKISCAVTGHPNPKVHWLKDAAPLDENSNCWSTDTYGVCSLNIAITNSKDAGHYTITAKNHLGEVTCGSTLMVIE